MTRVGLLLPTFDPFRGAQPLPVTAFARSAEELGFDGVWTGDHLVCPCPVLDAPTCLAACAAVTERISIGLSVMLLGMRPLVWSAKQLGTLHHLSGGRLELGVGIGGEFPQEYEAAGVPLRERGARLDKALEALPELLTDGTLEPTAPMPPVLVGGRSDAALRRAARFGDGWIPMWVSPETLGQRAERLFELADEQGRQPPKLALLMLVHANGDRARGRREADGHLRGQYEMPLDRVERWTGLGDAAEIAEFISRYVEIGVEDFVLMPIGSRQLEQVERLSEILGLLTSSSQPSRISK